MKQSVLMWTLAVTTASLNLPLPALAAQRGHGGPPKTSHPAPTTHAPAPHGQSGATHGGGSTKTHTTGASGHGHADTHAAAGKTTKTTTKTTTTTTGTTTLSPVQQKLQRNTNLADKLQGRLPAGTDLVAASAGFRNLGQFVAAVNVSNNLGIKFTDLKTRMVDQHLSLGQAIQDVRGGTDSQTVARHAEQEADQLIRTTDQTTTTSKSKLKTTAKPRKTHGTL